MRDSIEMSKGTFYTIAAICAVIIIAGSLLSAIINAKRTRKLKV